MLIENQVITQLNFDELLKGETLHIKHSILQTIDFISFHTEEMIIIENSIIDNFMIHNCWFKEGLLFRNNNVANYIDFQMGGHNIKPIVFESNIFTHFFNFFDCIFEDELIVQNNVFLKGTNLFGNKNEGFKNVFRKKVTVIGNYGAIDCDGTLPFTAI